MRPSGKGNARRVCGAACNTRVARVDGRNAAAREARWAKLFRNYDHVQWELLKLTLQNFTPLGGLSNALNSPIEHDFGARVFRAGPVPSPASRYSAGGRPRPAPRAHSCLARGDTVIL